jgi:hypothetical protein
VSERDGVHRVVQQRGDERPVADLAEPDRPDGVIHVPRRLVAAVDRQVALAARRHDVTRPRRAGRVARDLAQALVQQPHASFAAAPGRVERDDGRRAVGVRGRQHHLLGPQSQLARRPRPKVIDQPNLQRQHVRDDQQEPRLAFAFEVQAPGANRLEHARRRLRAQREPGQFDFEIRRDIDLGGADPHVAAPATAAGGAPASASRSA